MPSDNFQRSGNPLLWLFSLFALATASLIGLQKLPEKPEGNKDQIDLSKDGTGSDAQANLEISEPLKVLQEHLRVEGVKEDKKNFPNFNLNLKTDLFSGSFSLFGDKKESIGQEEQSLLKSLQIERPDFQFWIATVPDPIESKFPHEFDSVVDGIQRAFEAQGFILRASRLPWPHGKVKQGQAPDTSLVVRHHEYPGVLLFRKSRKIGDNLKIALVCLVGESPVSGIHKPAFYRALCVKSDLNKIIKKEDKNENNKNRKDKVHLAKEKIRIISPYFSGSQWSLILALNNWKENESNFIDSYLRFLKFHMIYYYCKFIENVKINTEFEIISGCATELRPDLFKKAGLNTPQTTVIPNDLVTSGVLSYIAGNRSQKIKDPNYKIDDQVAILREANTAFGRISGTSYDDELKDFLKSNLNQEKKRSFIDLPFPMGISQLHAEKEKENKSLLPSTGFVEPRLPIKDQNHLDSIPPYDPGAASSSAGLSLRMIMSVIDKARVRYVGIVATDTRDVVFLSQMLRKECPHVRVYTTEPSIALLHPDEAHHLRGMIVGSTYPLAPITQFWTRKKESPNRFIPFPSQGSQGYYNAVLAHFADKKPSDLTLVDKSPDFMLAYNSPDLPSVEKQEFGGPPIWISVIDQGGHLLPVHFFSDYKDQIEEKENGVNKYPKMFLGSNEKTEIKATFGIPIAMLLGSIGALAFLALVISALTFPFLWEKWVAGLTLEEAGEAGPNPDPYFQPLDSNNWIWLWRGVMLGGVLLFAIPYSFPAWEILNSPSSSLTWRHFFLLFISLVISIKIFAVAVLLLMRGLKILYPNYPGENPNGFLSLFFVVILFSAFIRTPWSYMNPVERFLLFFRSVDFSSGMSPVVPMMLLGAAAFLFGWFSLNQADLSRRKWLVCPYPTQWKDINNADQNLRSALSNFFVSLTRIRNPLTFLLGIIFGICALWNVIVSLPSGEGWVWDWTFRMVFWVMALAIVLTLARFLTLWSLLHDLIKNILQVPMVGAFEKLPVEINRLFNGYLSSHRPHFRQLAVAAWALPEKEREKLAKEMADKKLELDFVFGPIAPTRKPPLSFFRLDMKLKQLAEAFLLDLPLYWMSQSVNEAFGISSPETPKSNPVRGEEAQRIFQAKQFVASYVVLFLGQYFAQLRMLLYAMVSAAPLLLFTAASYPFLPERPILTTQILLLVAIAFGTMYVFYRINKNGLISRISQTTPDRFTPDLGFLTNLSTFVIPIVTLVVLQMLGLIRFIVEPILGLLF